LRLYPFIATEGIIDYILRDKKRINKKVIEWVNSMGIESV